MIWMYVSAYVHFSFLFLSFHFISYNVAISEILSPLQISFQFFLRFSPPCKSHFIFLEILSPLQISFLNGHIWDFYPFSISHLITQFPPHISPMNAICIFMPYVCISWMQYGCLCLYMHFIYSFQWIAPHKCQSS